MPRKSRFVRVAPKSGYLLGAALVASTVQVIGVNPFLSYTLQSGHAVASLTGAACSSIGVLTVVFTVFANAHRTADDGEVGVSFFWPAVVLLVLQLCLFVATACTVVINAFGG